MCGVTLLCRKAIVIAIGVWASSLLCTPRSRRRRPSWTDEGFRCRLACNRYLKPDYPLGSGPYKAIMAVEPGLSAHVAYYPANLAALGTKKLPVVIWGNGSCLLRRQSISLASHRTCVAWLPGDRRWADGCGRIGSRAAEQPGSTAGRSGRGARGERTGSCWPRVASARGRSSPPPPRRQRSHQERVTVPLLKEAVDWAIQQNGSADSRFNDRLDLRWIVSMGHSCGGGLPCDWRDRGSAHHGLASGSAEQGSPAHAVRNRNR